MCIKNSQFFIFFSDAQVNYALYDKMQINNSYVQILGANRVSYFDQFNDSCYPITFFTFTILKQLRQHYLYKFTYY